MHAFVNGTAINLPLVNDSVQACITSPPYWRLRDYGVDGQLGQEQTIQAYIDSLVGVFREVWRVLKPNGTLWVNIGDSYANKPGNGRGGGSTLGGGTPHLSGKNRVPDGIKQKDLIGLPWMLAFALRDDGWYLRQDIIWAKPNPMPESVKDRFTKSHEYVFLLSKQSKYYFDHDAIIEPAQYDGRHDTMLKGSQKYSKPTSKYLAPNSISVNGGERWAQKTSDGKPGRSKRSVWSIPTKPYRGAHFAVFPPNLVRTMVLAATKPGDVVLDPFSGTATVGEVCLSHSRHFVGVDINPKYIKLAIDRLATVQLSMV